MSSTTCKIDHDSFCFICAEYVSGQKRGIGGTSFVENYREKFGIDPKEQNEKWSPKVVCLGCYPKL